MSTNEETNTTEAEEIETTDEVVEAQDEAEAQEAEEVTDDASEDGESDEKLAAKESEEKVKPKKVGGFQRKINKLNTRLSTLEQEKEYWRKAALGSEGDSEETAQAASPQGKPSKDNYESHDDYLEALLDWKAEQKFLEKERVAKEMATRSERRTKFQAHVEKVEKFSDEHDDFDEAIEAVNHIRISAAVEEAIVDSDVGPELMYELAKNPKEYARICELGPIAAAKEIGRIESKILSQKEAGTASSRTTKAPKPIKPVGGTARASASKNLYDPNLSQAEFERLREEQLNRQTS